MYPSQETREFYKDVKSKKSLVPSARRMKRGSKTRFVSLPHDHMTEREWKKMNGEVVSYKLREPMTWEEFKALPPDHMVEYIKFLQNTFGASAKRIATCFGVCALTFKKLLISKDIGSGSNADGKPFTYQVSFPHGSRQNKEQEHRINVFFGLELDDQAEDEDEIDTPEVEAVSAEIVNNGSTEVSTVREDKAPPLFRSNMSKFRMEFAGPYDEMSLVNTMRLMVGNGVNCKITIEVEKGDE